MKVIVVGGTGTIGRAIVDELSQRHEVVIVGHSSGDFKVDITSTESIQTMYQEIGGFDALISAIGKVQFAPFEEMKDAQYRVGLDHKLMGQVNLVVEGRDLVNDGGSFTLTTGLLNHDPIKMGSSAAMVNGALEGFVTGSAIEMSRNIRINAVSPTVITEAMEAYAPFFRGYEPVSAARTALAYAKSVEGLQTGKVYRVGW